MSVLRLSVLKLNVKRAPDRASLFYLETLFTWCGYTKNIIANGPNKPAIKSIEIVISHAVMNKHVLAFIRDPLTAQNLRTN